MPPLQIVRASARPLVWLPIVLCAALLPGCFFNQPDNSSTSDGGANGFGQPTLEVTVGGVHFGPAAPDPRPALSLTNVTDPLTGRVTSSTFQLSASSNAAGAGCQIAIQRYGTDIAPLGVGQFTISSDPNGQARGAVLPLSGESVTTTAGTWVCSGSGCDGGLVTINVFDTSRIEGYLSATMQSQSGGPAADVICSFYLPLQ